MAYKVEHEVVRKKYYYPKIVMILVFSTIASFIILLFHVIFLSGDGSATYFFFSCMISVSILIWILTLEENSVLFQVQEEPVIEHKLKYVYKQDKKGR